jgi:hypothetical protein
VGWGAADCTIESVFIMEPLYRGAEGESY